MLDFETLDSLMCLFLLKNLRTEETKMSLGKAILLLLMSHSQDAGSLGTLQSPLLIEVRVEVDNCMCT